MKNREKVSIVTVCYNSQETIQRTIESVLNQTYDNIEYILVDGLSSDHTVKVAQSYELQFKEKGYDMTILSEKDNGIYDAMNKGIRIAHGEIVGLINSGDWYELEAVKRVVDTYDTTKFDMFYADLRIWKNGNAVIKHSKMRDYVTTRDWNHPTTFIRSSIYKEFQYKCRGIYDDWDLVLRIRNAGYKIVILNEILANFVFGGASNQKSASQAINRAKERYQIYRENGYSCFYILECIAMEMFKYLWA